MSTPIETAIGIYDDVTRTFTPRDFETGELGEPRPYDSDENANADSRAAFQERGANTEVLRVQVGQQVATLLASIATLKTVTDKTNAQITAADTKAVARETRVVARAVVRMARIMGDVLDATTSE